MKREDLIHWEGLAKLSLTEKEREVFCGDLRELLDFCAPLRDLPKEGMLTELPSVTREDEPHDCLAREALLESAPTHEDGMITVPKSL